MKKAPKYNTRKNTSVSSKVEEPEPVYRTVKMLPKLKDFTYNDFKKISDKAPFTLAEWSSMLHVSERTLQRYAKNNGIFASINSERAMQIAAVLSEGKRTFGKVESFYQWLKNNPQMLEGPLSLESLTTANGIQMVLTQLKRIQHGILA